MSGLRSQIQEITEPAFVSFRMFPSPLLPAPVFDVNKAAPLPHSFSFLSHSQRKKQISSSTSLDQIQKLFSSHLNYTDLLTFDLGETEGKGDMNLATGFDLLGSLGNSGEGFSGVGGERRAGGGSPLGRLHAFHPGYLRSPFSVLPHLSEHLLNYKTA